MKKLAENRTEDFAPEDGCVEGVLQVEMLQR